VRHIGGVEERKRQRKRDKGIETEEKGQRDRDRGKETE
jgi:hypothetical protein